MVAESAYEKFGRFVENLDESELLPLDKLMIVKARKTLLRFDNSGCSVDGVALRIYVDGFSGMLSSSHYINNSKAGEELGYVVNLLKRLVN